MGLTSICVILNCSRTIVARIVYDLPSDSYFLSLSSDMVFMKFRQKIFKMENYKPFYHFYFFNNDISATNQYIKLRVSACILNIPV